MLLTENTDQNAASLIVEQKTDPSAVPVPVSAAETATPETVKQPRNQHLKVDQPKSRQFTARCTQEEYDQINDAMKANNRTDIVRLMLFSINLHKNDLFTSFKIK